MRLAVSHSSFRWWVSLALLLPVIVLYACEYFGANGNTFTGFIQYDQPYYMANARKFFDGGFYLLYGNPFSPDPNTPRIYFQIHLLVLGFLQFITGCDPGVLYVIFGFFAALICVRVAMALYEQVAGLDSPAKWTGLVLFMWGGGIFALFGLCFHLFEGSDFHTTVTDLFHFDPAQGWWFLNLGRNLVLPTEAYYHALALGAVLMVMRGNFRVAIWLIFLLAISHPFTGLQFLLIFLAWCGLEIVVFRNRGIPFAFPALLVCILFFHLVYNLILLNLFLEHRAVFLQWGMAWTESATAFVLAYVLVGLLAYCTVHSSKNAHSLFASASNRLLLVWLGVSLVLVHHDLIITSQQPLHFTRGYVWIPLFLLVTQALTNILERCFSVKSPGLRIFAVCLVLLIGLSDNLAWFSLHTAMALSPRWGVNWMAPDGFRLEANDRQFFQWLEGRPGPHTELLVTADNNSSLVYLAMTYTDYRSWYSHFAITPFANQRQGELISFFNDGTIPPAWHGRTHLVITDKPSESDQGGHSSLPLEYTDEKRDVWLMKVP
jgi:hypothetical protein